MTTAPSPQRTIVYVDGFNLYFGLREAGWQKYYWLNMVALASQLAGPNRHLILTRYFTSRIAGGPKGNASNWAVRKNAKRKRQADYLEALQTLPNIQIAFGHYLDKQLSCQKCGAQWTSHEEKMTDVNIATALLTDAFQDRFDTAIVISADSDLVPPLRDIKTTFPQKHLIVAFPPKRFSVSLKNTAHQTREVRENTLATCQLPDPVTLANGYLLHRPTHWN